MRCLPFLLFLPLIASVADARAQPGAATTLTVRHPTSQAAVEVVAEPKVRFVCSAAGDPGHATTICRGTTTARSLTLRIMRQPPPEYPFLRGYVAGNQWGGACAGTRGTICALDMSAAREVSVSFDGEG